MCVGTPTPHTCSHTNIQTWIHKYAFLKTISNDFVDCFSLLRVRIRGDLFWRAVLRLYSQFPKMLLEAQSKKSEPPEPAFPVDLGKQSTLKAGCKTEATVPTKHRHWCFLFHSRNWPECSRTEAEKKSSLHDQRQGRTRSQTHTLKLLCNFPWEES